MPITIGPNMESRQTTALESIATSLERIAKCLENKNQ